MGQYYSGFTCTLCHKEYKLDSSRPDSSYTTCPTCGDKGILDVNYDYESIKKVMTKESLKENQEETIWRYVDLLPVKGIPDMPMLKVGNTPLYRGHGLEKALDVKEVYVKDDGLNPTGSLKDRASLMAVAKAYEEGIKTICCSSTGNAASSLAGNAAKAGLDTVIFVPERVPTGKMTQIIVFGSKLTKVQGDYKNAYNMSKDAIDSYGFYNRNAAINPYLVEGKKTVVYEIMEQLNFKSVDWIVISVGDGCSVGGVYKGLYDFKQIGLIDDIPKILGVQASGCNPFDVAFKSSQGLVEMDENTIADSIAVGIPRNPIKGMDAIVKSKGSFISVTDEEIINAKFLLGRSEGVFAEPAATASLAGYVKALENKVISKKESVVVISTGNGLKDAKGGLLNIDVPDSVEATHQALEKELKDYKKIKLVDEVK